MPSYQVIECVGEHRICYLQEFAKAMDAESIKADLIQLFHNLANDEQVKHVSMCGSIYSKRWSLGRNIS